MNSYEIIKNGIENELDDVSIIDELQQYYPDSQIESNIFLIDETRSLLESSSKALVSEIKLNHFLIKNGKEFIDLFSGRRFKPFTNKPYSLCHHGLCKKYNTLLLKNITKNRHTPGVFIAIDEKPIEHKSIKIKYHDNNKKQRVWDFDSYEINECMLCIDKGLKDGQIATKLFCPRECVQKLIKQIEINQKMNRSRNVNGNRSNKIKIRMGKRGTKRQARGKN